MSEIYFCRLHTGRPLKHEVAGYVLADSDDEAKKKLLERHRWPEMDLNFCLEFTSAKKV